MDRGRPGRGREGGGALRRSGTIAGRTHPVPIVSRVFLDHLEAPPALDAGATLDAAPAVDGPPAVDAPPATVDAPAVDGGSTGLTGPLRDVRHVVIFVQENRAFDNDFGALSGVRGFEDPAAQRPRTGGSRGAQRKALTTV